MKAYVQPDFEVMTFAANEYISLCYDVGEGSEGGAGVWCQAGGDGDGRTFYTLDNQRIDDIIPGKECNSNTTQNEHGATTYDCWATDLQEVTFSGSTYWANAYYVDDSNVSNKNYIVRFFEGIWHFVNSNNFRPVDIEKNPGSWTNMS